MEIKSALFQFDQTKFICNVETDSPNTFEYLTFNWYRCQPPIEIKDGNISEQYLIEEIGNRSKEYTPSIEDMDYLILCKISLPKSLADTENSIKSTILSTEVILSEFLTTCVDNVQIFYSKDHTKKTLNVSYSIINSDILLNLSQIFEITWERNEIPTSTQVLKSPTTKKSPRKSEKMVKKENWQVVKTGKNYTIGENDEGKEIRACIVVKTLNPLNKTETEYLLSEKSVSKPFFIEKSNTIFHLACSLHRTRSASFSGILIPLDEQININIDSKGLSIIRKANKSPYFKGEWKELIIENANEKRIKLKGNHGYSVQIDFLQMSTASGLKLNEASACELFKETANLLIGNMH